MPPPYIRDSVNVNANTVTAYTTVQAIDEDGLQENSRRVGGVLLEGMLSLREEFEVVGDVRGKGLMLGMELVKNKVRL